MSKKEKIKKTGDTFVHEVVSLWTLIVTIASAMAAYILIPQDELVYRVVGAVLLVSAAISAVKAFTRR